MATNRHLFVAQGDDLPYNAKLGTYCGVDAFSNLNEGFFSGQKHYTEGVHTGFSWQCVEYARRYTVLRKGLSFAPCGRSSEIFEHKVIKEVNTDEELEWPSVNNGSVIKPVEGSIILWPFEETLLPWGHVAVISHVEWFSAEDRENNKKSAEGSGLAAFVGRDGTGEVVGFVGLAEQNVESKAWGDRHYCRTIPVVARDAGGGETSYTLEEPNAPTKILDPLGWKPLPEQVADRGVPPTQPLQPKSVDTFPTPYFVREPLQKSVVEFPKEEDEAREDKGKMPPSLQLLADKGIHPKFVARHNPQNEGGERTVGGTHYAMSAIDLTMQHLLKSSMDVELAEWFEMPIETIPLVRKHFFISTSMMGSVVMSFHSNHASLAQISLDSTEGLIECTLQDQVATVNEMNQGFSPSTYTQDAGRALRRRMAHANKALGLEGEVAVKTMHFIDTSAPDAHYERAQALGVYETFLKAIRESDDLKKNNLQVKWVSASELSWNADKTLVVDAEGQVVRVVKKSSAWAHIFATYHPVTGKNTTHSGLYDMLLHPSLLVFEPLWAAMASHPTFLQFLFDLARDGKFLEVKGQNAGDIKQMVDNLNLGSATSEAVWAQLAAGNTVHAMRSRTSNDGQDSSTMFFSATRSFVFEGAMSCMITIEAPESVEVSSAGQEVETVCPVAQLTNVGVLRFIFE